MAEITFMDANTVIPDSGWDLYRHFLVKTKPGSSHRISNSDIEETALVKAMDDLVILRKYLEGRNDIVLTQGVVRQASVTIDNIAENVIERSNNYIFIEFNSLIPLASKERGKRVFQGLQEYSRDLNLLKESFGKYAYVNPKEEPYFIISNFVRALKDVFYDLVKDNHNYDFNVDEFITVASLYESIANKKAVKVISNDGDIARMLGASYCVFEKVKPVIGNNENFDFFFAHPPEVYNWKDYPRDPVPVNIREKGRECIEIFSEFDLKRTLSDAERDNYYLKATKFTNFMQNSITELEKSLATKTA